MIIPCSEWRTVTKAPKLIDNQVHVWRIPLNQAPERVHSISSVLAEDEKSRAARIRGDKNSREYTFARALLRILLSQYLNVNPSQLQFSYSKHGKPELADAFGGDLLQFNVSHSDGVGVYAVTRGRAVGIDIERVRRAFDYQEIERQFFKKNEPSDFQSMSAHAFFRRWTRSEALAKGMGKGLDQFSMAVEEKKGWTVIDLDPIPGYVAAIAVEGEFSTLECFKWKMI